MEKRNWSMEKRNWSMEKRNWSMEKRNWSMEKHKLQAMVNGERNTSAAQLVNEKHQRQETGQ